MGVEPTGDGVTRHPPVLKNTSGVLIGYENFLLYLISQPLTSQTLLTRSADSVRVMNIELSRFYHSSRSAAGHHRP